MISSKAKTTVQAQKNEKIAATVIAAALLFVTPIFVFIMAIILWAFSGFDDIAMNAAGFFYLGIPVAISTLTVIMTLRLKKQGRLTTTYAPRIIIATAVLVAVAPIALPLLTSMLVGPSFERSMK